MEEDKHLYAPSVISSTSNSSVLSAAGSVSSSGYQSPSVITLDSPSPPTSPIQSSSCTQNQQRSACMMEMYDVVMYNNMGKSMPYLDIDDSNGASSYFPQF